MLMRMDRGGLLRREPKVTASHVWASGTIPEEDQLDHIRPPREVESALDIDAEANDDEVSLRSDRQGSLAAYGPGEFDELKQRRRKGKLKNHPRSHNVGYGSGA